MTAVAHPTPDFTVMAPEAQFLAHAPHSMQASRSTIKALPSPRTSTAALISALVVSDR